MKRAHSFLLLLLLLLSLSAVLPANAQTLAPTDPLGWIPADFSAYVRVDLSDLSRTNLTLNMGMYAAAVLQPTRSTYTSRLNFNAFFPMVSILDVEDALFETDVLPWVGDSIVIAYKTLQPDFISTNDDVLMLLPITDPFQAAGYLHRIIDKQDLLKRDVYRNQTLYLGDQVAFAFTPEAVIIGAADLVKASLDVRAGAADSLATLSLPQNIEGALAGTASGATLTAYLSQDAAQNALAFLVGAGDAGTPILNALGGALAHSVDPDAAANLVISGGFDAVGIQVSADLVHTSLLGHVVIHTKNAMSDADHSLDSSLLNMIPRSAIIVQSGGSAESALRTGLSALPLTGFAGLALGAFPVSTSGGATTGAVPSPTSGDLDAALNSFTEALQPVVNIDQDILQNLTGSYALAVLPRQNDPLALLNSPVDLLLVAQAADADSASAAADHVTTLIQTFSDTLTNDTLDNYSFRSLRAPRSNEPVLSIGTVGNMLVIGTGDAPSSALAALRGDNRLIDQARWQNVSSETVPTTYIDAGALINLMDPQAGAPANLPIKQIGITSHALSADMLELDAIVLLN